MKLRFTKMHGLGNDFVMIDAISQHAAITPDRARRIADRNFGIGCDQVLVIDVPSRPDADFRYRIFNNDGSEVQNCGNGARCFALFVRQRRLTGKKVIRAETANGLLVLHVLENDHVRVDMGAPILTPKEIPFDHPSQQAVYPLDIEGLETPLETSAVSMGNPHAVILVEDTETYPVEVIGPQVEAHERFPENVNAGFMQILDKGEVNLRVYERGVGETLACGTGACAAVVAGRVRGLLNEKVKVNLPGGQLLIEWPGEGKPVLMTGPATTVFHGQTKL